MRNLRGRWVAEVRLGTALGLMGLCALHGAPAPLQIDAREYPDATAALAAVGDKRGVLLVAEPVEVRRNLMPGRHVQIRFTGNGRFTVASGVTVAIAGPIEAPLVQIFAGAGTATFAGGNTAVAHVYPQWWGARGDDRNDDTVAIQRAIDAVRDLGGGEVVITAGTFKTTRTLYLWGVEKWDNQPDDRCLGTRGIHLSGVSRRASVIHFTGTGPALWLYTSELDGVRYYHTGTTVQCLHLLGAEVRDSVGLRVSAPRLAGSTGGSTCVQNCAIEQFDVGLQVEHSYGALFSYNKIRYNNTGVQVGSRAEGGVYSINGNSFRDNEISLNRGVGLLVHNGDHNLFEGGLIEGNGAEGIHIERTRTTASGYLTFRNIWIEANQRDKPAGEFGQVYLHSLLGAGYQAQRPVTFERCFFNGQGRNYHLRLGNTLGLQLICNQFSHPNDRIISRMPGTTSAWAAVHCANEDQNKVIQGVLAPTGAGTGDGSRNDLVGTSRMPHVFFPANAAKSAPTADIEADARTHSAIASAAGVFTTQHALLGDDRDKPIVLPAGVALIGLSVCTVAAPEQDVRITLVIGGRPTSLAVVLPKGRTSVYRDFRLADYSGSQDWVAGSERTVSFSVQAAPPEAAGAIRLVAFWRSNHMPVF